MANAADDPRPTEPSWTSSTLRLVFAELPRYLDAEGQQRLDALAQRYDASVLDALERAPADPAAVQALARTRWHAAVEARAKGLRARKLAALSIESAVDLGRSCLEEAHLCLVEQEDLEPDRRAQRLLVERDRLTEVSERLRTLAVAAGEAQRQEAAPVLRHLRALARRLENQADEAELVRRLERLFGPRPVLWFARFTFGCLCLLMAVLLAGWWLPESEEWQAWHRGLAVFDTALCLVLLWDFAVRLALAPRRGRWFLRHAVTDFVPALPFGLLLHGTEAEGALAVHLLRLLRLPSFARYLRLLQPIVRLLRLAVFWVQGLDRLVQSLAPVLNREIVFFEPDARPEARPAPAADVVGSFLRRPEALRRQEAPELLARASAEVEVRLASPGEPTARPAPSSTVCAETVVAALQALDAAAVERALPQDTVRRLGRLVGAMAMTPLRWLPVAGRILRGGSGATPAERVAGAGRALGDRLQGLLALVTAWSDLSGIVTAPQVLDRFATAVMRATQRPAVRLLLFGSFFVLVKLFFEVVPGLRDRSKGFVELLDRFVATPLLVIGSFCLVLLLSARWLKRIAGEASDRLVRLAEARYANLLDLLRRQREDVDRLAIAERLTRLSPLAQGESKSDLDLEIGVAADELRGRFSPGTRAGLRGRRLALLLLDYQDGAFLHRSDTSACEQFLEHPDLWSLRHQHLCIGRREARRLTKLDVLTGGTFSGPFLWFDLTTEALAVRVARLVASYNLYLLPRCDLERADPQARAWHAELLAGGELLAEPGAARSYRTSAFHVLHFLDPDPRWLAEVAAEFGPEVEARLVADRRALVRGMFGVQRATRRPRHERVFNPFRYWQGRLARGRILLLPLTALFAWLGLLWFTGCLLVRAVRDILMPRLVRETEPVATVSFTIARRKLRRLKKPLLLAAIHLAVRVDPDYAGLDESGGEAAESLFAADLAAADPTPHESRPLFVARAAAASRLIYLPGFRRDGQPTEAAHVAAARRLRCAFAMDEAGLARLAAAEERARAWLRQATAGGVPAGALLAEGVRLDRRRARRGLDLLLAHLGDIGRHEARALRCAFRQDRGDLRLVCQAFGEAAPLRPLAAARERAALLLADAGRFAARLETLQALLALLRQDLAHHEELVWQLGEFGSLAPATEVAPPRGTVSPESARPAMQT